MGPYSLETFPGTCKRNFLCLQMISFEFLRAASIGWTVSRGKHFVHMTRPGARDSPAACFPRPISHAMKFTTCFLPSFVKFYSVVAEGKSNMSQPIRGRATLFTDRSKKKARIFTREPKIIHWIRGQDSHICWPTARKNTNLVEDVDHLLPVKLRWAFVERYLKIFKSIRARDGHLCWPIGWYHFRGLSDIQSPFFRYKRYYFEGIYIILQLYLIIMNKHVPFARACSGVASSSQATVFESVFYGGSRRRTQIPWLATMVSLELSLFALSHEWHIISLFRGLFQDLSQYKVSAVACRMIWRNLNHLKLSFIRLIPH